MSIALDPAKLHHFYDVLGRSAVAAAIGVGGLLLMAVVGAARRRSALRPGRLAYVVALIDNVVVYASWSLIFIGISITTALLIGLCVGAVLPDSDGLSHIMREAAPFAGFVVGIYLANVFAQLVINGGLLLAGLKPLPIDWTFFGGVKRQRRAKKKSAGARP